MASLILDVKSAPILTSTVSLRLFLSVFGYEVQKADRVSKRFVVRV